VMGAWKRSVASLQCSGHTVGKGRWSMHTWDGMIPRAGGGGGGVFFFFF
jgi:hypothetical protein